MNGKFFTLPEEKQKRIINAAYVVFADNSYQKASMSRIAAAGGISKSLLFHYFHNKKELYLYLWENINRISCEIELKYYKETTDFFEIMTRKILARCEFMRTAPDEYLFSIRALFAEPLEIREATGKSYKEVYDGSIQQQEGDQHHDPHHKKTGKDRNIPTVIPEGIPACAAFHALVRFFHAPPHFQ